ncbi:MAG: hypothetical protein Q7T03_11005, partial [Deltaproteobacteria bacterium]|nr:hypothetical protein [Deltaproteobacteria bacterium]
MTVKRPTIQRQVLQREEPVLRPLNGHSVPLSTSSTEDSGYQTVEQCGLLFAKAPPLAGQPAVVLASKDLSTFNLDADFIGAFEKYGTRLLEHSFSVLPSSSEFFLLQEFVGAVRREGGLSGRDASELGAKFRLGTESENQEELFDSEFVLAFQSFIEDWISGKVKVYVAAVQNGRMPVPLNRGRANIILNQPLSLDQLRALVKKEIGSSGPPDFVEAMATFLDRQQKAPMEDAKGIASLLGKMWHVNLLHDQLMAEEGVDAA